MLSLLLWELLKATWPVWSWFSYPPPPKKERALSLMISEVLFFIPNPWLDFGWVWWKNKIQSLVEEHSLESCHAYPSVILTLTIAKMYQRLFTCEALCWLLNTFTCTEGLQESNAVSILQRRTRKLPEVREFTQLIQLTTSVTEFRFWLTWL